MSYFLPEDQFNYNNWFSKTHEKLTSLLKLQGFNSINSEQSKQVIDNSLTEIEFEQAHFIKYGKGSIQWQLIEIKNGNKFTNRDYDHTFISKNKEDALANVIEIIDKNRLVIDKIQKLPCGGYQFFNKNKVVIQYSTLEYASVNQQSKSRVESAFKGVRVYNNKEKLIKKLKKLPGFKFSFDNIEIEKPKREPKGPACLSNPGNWVRIFRDSLSQYANIELPINQCQEMIALLLNTQSYQHLLSEKHEIDPHPYMLELVNNIDSISQSFIFKNSTDAIISLNDYLYKNKLKIDLDFHSSESSSRIYFSSYNYDDNNPEPYVQLYQLGHNYPDDNYIDFAKSILNTSKDPLQILEISLSINDAMSSKIKKANTRMNINNRHQIKLGNWLFSLKSFNHTPESEYLSGEYFIKDEKLNEFCIPLYKSNLIYNEDNKLSLYTDYKSDFVMDMTDFDINDLKQFTEITGLNIPKIYQ